MYTCNTVLMAILLLFHFVMTNNLLYPYLCLAVSALCSGAMKERLFSVENLIIARMVFSAR